VPDAVRPADGAALGEDRDLVAAMTQGLTDDLLGSSPTLERGGVNPIDADVERRRDCRHCGVSILRTPPQRTVPQRPQRCCPDAHPASQHHLEVALDGPWESGDTTGERRGRRPDDRESI
jgi:hypothetical protein